MMAGNFIAVLLAASIAQFPFMPGAGPGPGSTPYGGGAVNAAPDSTHAFGTGDPTYPYDYEAPWAHGYHQEIPAYGGFHFMRPYNYKHVMPQSQVSAAWGNSPNMPYSHQYFDRVSGHPHVYNGQPSPATAARGPADINAQLAEVDRAPRAKPKRKGAPSLVQFPTRQKVTQAGHGGQ